MIWKALFNALMGGRRRGGEDGGGSLHVHSKGGGLGDELMALCAAQAACRSQPTLKVTLCARYHVLFAGAPQVCEVQPLHEGNAALRGTGITYGHRQALPILRQMTAQLGAPDADDFRLELPERPLKLPQGWPHGERPKVLVQTSASDWTPNKQWLGEHWITLIESLPHEFSIVEVGAKSVLPVVPRHPGWHTLAGKTSLEEFISCFRAATLFLGPVSSGMHLAHGFGLPSVIIVGGYEAANFPYPLAVQLGSRLECAPCWLRSQCPYDRRCLSEITPDEVRSHLMAQLGGALQRHG